MNDGLFDSQTCSTAFFIAIDPGNPLSRRQIIAALPSRMKRYGRGKCCGSHVRSRTDRGSDRPSQCAPIHHHHENQVEDAQIASVLNDLVETSRDGATGLETCAEGAKDSMQKVFSETRAQNCEEAVRELNIEVLHHNGKPIEHGSATAALRRAWIKVRTAVTSNDDLAVLEECERAEDAALEAYIKALEEDLPNHVRTLLQKAVRWCKGETQSRASVA